MSETTYSISLKMAYTGTDYTRTYKFNNVDASALANVKNKVINYNENLSAADKKIFISDDYDSAQNIGELASITAASYESVEYTRINLN
ncbi:MAG: hypothetical protein IJP68_09900 [Selenomonadaceae bacterium]|nr:hypothetical protein [Selenomonadaceae bacterium]